MAESFPPWGAPPVPPNRYSRTLPRWMDPSDLYGEVQFLVLKPAKDHQLPKNPFTISKSIDQSVGRIDGASPFDGGKSILLRVRSQQQCEKLLQLRNLIDGTPITVEPHPTKNTCQSVVSCQDVAGLSDADICEALQDQKVVKVYRFTRKDNGKSIPTNTMVLTFSGTVPPTHVWFGYLRVSTRPYYPRPMQCFQCGRFGHTKAKCPNPAICQNCGEATIHPSCSNLPHCINCLGNHQTTARTCPAYQQEQSIVRIRVDMGISHAEARKEFRSRLNTATQSNVQQRLINAHSTSHNTASKVQELEQQIAELIKKNIELQAQISQMDTEKKNTCDDSDATLTDASSEASMDTTDISQQLSSTPKRGRGHESPDQTSPVRKMKPKNPSTQTIHVLATPRYDIQPNPNHPSYTALNHPNQR